MPHKFNEPRRHRVPKAKYRVTNWSDYDRGLVERGDVRFWISDDALAAWIAPRRRTRGRPAQYSDLAIETVLLVAAAFDLPLRQAEGFTRSIFALMKLDLPVPDHTTLARRRRTVSIDMHAPGRKAPVDLVLDSTGLKFYGPPLGDVLRNRLPGSGRMGPQEAWRKASRLEEVARQRRCGNRRDPVPRPDGQ